MKKLLFFLVALPVFAFPCTSILVGKGASADGSTMIARNADSNSLTNHHYFYHKPGADAGKIFKSTYSNFTYPNSKKPLGYASFAKAKTNDKSWGSAGFNDLGIGMSGTESIYSSEEALKADPMPADGINEDSLVSVILPRIHSAKEGAALLGEIITKQGTAEGMGVSFIDKDEVWYLETASGHRWLATKLPKDQYFVSGNQARFQDYDPKDKENYMASDDLVEFAAKNKLTKDGEKFNFQDYIKHELNDVTYNHPRVYYLQGLYTKNNTDILAKPLEFPVFATPTAKLSVQDVEKGLRMHYNNGLHDTYQEKNPKEPFRPASVFRTYQGHILQIRPNLPEAISHVTYIAWGMTDLSTFIPFYKGAKIPAVFKAGIGKQADKKSGYWRFRRPQTLAMQNYPVYAPIVKDAYAKLEEKEVKEMKTFEAKYSKTLKSSPAKAQKMLDTFQAKLVKDALKTADDLENTLMTTLTNDTETLYKFHGL